MKLEIGSPSSWSNTAIDVARSVLRWKEGHPPYRVQRGMPAFEEEIREAWRRVKIRTGQSIRIQQKDDRKRLECLRMELGEKDESGRRNLFHSHSNFFFEADNVIIAAGERLRWPSSKGMERREGSFLHRKMEDRIRIFAGEILRQSANGSPPLVPAKSALAMDCYLKAMIQRKRSGKFDRRGSSFSIFRYLHPGERPMNPMWSPLKN